MTPYPETFDGAFRDTNTRSFNFAHSSTRMVVERAFGVAKERFRVLKMCIDVDDMGRSVDIIATSIVLHNILIALGLILTCLLYLMSAEKIKISEAVEDRRKRIYNRLHSRTRIVVECAFKRSALGQVKAEVIIANLKVWHNLLVLVGDYFEVEDLDLLAYEDR
ncbi:DDE superfamily endonuclease [Phytophthora infestans]|uniref:DDE superfamily endonuclease n=1 Tax=Phytophthora infestans TaxID=4787 RepID=A0A833WA09_PHYIN|nr:DDE superfamily endonuclease [Phytophthora infestans]